MLNRDDLGEATFGAFDGLVSAIGVIVGLLSRSSHVLLVAAAGLAVASTVGMGAGQYLGDETINGRRRLAKAAVMGLATAVGTMVPASPFFFTSGWRAVALMILGAVTLAALIAWTRCRVCSVKRAFVETYSILAVAAGLTVAMTAVTGAG